MGRPVLHRYLMCVCSCYYIRTKCYPFLRASMRARLDVGTNTFVLCSICN